MWKRFCQTRAISAFRDWSNVHIMGTPFERAIDGFPWGTFIGLVLIAVPPMCAIAVLLFR